MADSAELVRAFVAAFIAAWPEQDAEALRGFFSEDAVYHNVPMEPVHGQDAIVRTLQGFTAMGGTVDVEMVHLLGGDSVVMTERVDRFDGPDGTLALPVMGVFEVRDGTITAWRDYFDSAHLRTRSPGIGQPWLSR